MKKEEKKQAVLEAMAKQYAEQLDNDMGQLHNQFVGFISASKLPLPQVALVLEILLRETVDEAMKRYLGV